MEIILNEQSENSSQGLLVHKYRKKEFYMLSESDFPHTPLPKITLFENNMVSFR
jgi:hypothetical protein